MRAPITDAPAARMRRRRAVVGRPCRLRHLRRQPFELAAPDIFEVLARRIRRRVFVQEDRQREPRRHVGGNRLRQLHALRHRHAFDRNERHHVDGAHARMFALVRAQVDVGKRALEQHRNAGGQRRGVAGQREDRAVVRGVGLHVEHAQARAPPRARRPCAAMTSGRRPSLTFGTHSITAMCRPAYCTLRTLTAPQRT